MKTLVYEIKDWQKEYLEKNLESGFELSFSQSSISPNGDPEAEILCIFVDSKADGKVLEKYPKLKFIATRSTGFNHVDLKYCKNKNILVSNVPDYGKNTVAEHAFALLLSISKKIPQSLERTRRSNFNYEKLIGFDLFGKTIGVIGTGKIGTHVIKIAKGFGMNILAADPKPNFDLAKQYSFKYVELPELLSKSDVITVHVPLIESTLYLINKENIKIIKKGAVLINTSRGEIVETDALIWALNEGIISAAGLDVLEGENFLKDELGKISRESKKTLHDYKILAETHILMDMENVIVTPHNAFNTKEALTRILKTTIENIRGFADGKPVNLIANKD